MTSASDTAGPHHPGAAGDSAHDPQRRDFLSLAAVAMSAAGLALACWPFIDSMEPAEDTRAMGAPRDLDISKIQPGSQIIYRWRGKPMFVLRRTPAMLETLKDKDLRARLRDPDSTTRQQADYATNWHRSIKPEYAILVGVCTHLGCIPALTEQKGAVGPGWEGGYFCHCHGSKYDFAGRVFKGVPAPYNLPVPPYNFTADNKLRIGENPKGADFSMNDVRQI